MRAVIRSTYRLQFNRAFGFDRACEVAAYIRDLGVSHIYASPILRSGPESAHGYDVCSQEEIDPKLGGQAAFETLLGRLNALGLGLIVDIVPNHMRAGLSNGWWRDILENGMASRYANYFDIDWETDVPNLRHRVLIPILGDPYADVLERGELRVVFAEGFFWVSCYQHRFPLSPADSLEILKKQVPPD
jgi:(1->4)-alpha-D-glucan 1-alpha-D-glucosylmutase